MMRGNLEKTFETGCMRAFITDSRRSAVTISRRRESMVKLGSSAVACRIWLRVSTSSPTRFIMRLSRTTSTRRVLSEAAATLGLLLSAAGSGALWKLSEMETARVLVAEERCPNREARAATISPDETSRFLGGAAAWAVDAETLAST
jgi:hypothetical protein